MVEAWYYNTTDRSDGRYPHQYTPNRPVPLSLLAKMGIQISRIDVSLPNYMVHMDEICTERAYKHRDEITISKELLPNYEHLISMFFTEHMHPDEEIRFVVEGSGFFDVRSPNDVWIRIKAAPSDLIVLPAGLYHRFTLDASNYIKCVRVFKEVRARYRQHAAFTLEAN
ncbi:acireductone dioxygenase [Spizellomyces sp. 'palustris']|nr:acireductone dioxygenase [Spizellomyces sp. 'palustris']